MVNEERVQLWVDALRSGDYQQVTGTLGRENVSGEITYCCLGVACEVAMAHGLNLTRVVGAGWISYDGMDADLPAAVNEWYGFDEGDCEVRLSGRRTAMQLNDSEGFTFPQIADELEKEFLSC